MRKMSQADGRNWRKRALAAEHMLREQRNSWAEDWPNGTQIGAVDVAPDIFAIVRTARKLKHAVVVSDIGMNTSRIAFFGLPLPELP